MLCGNLTCYSSQKCYNGNKYEVILTAVTYLYHYVTSGVCHVCDDVSQCFNYN